MGPVLTQPQPAGPQLPHDQTSALAPRAPAGQARAQVASGAGTRAELVRLGDRPGCRFVAPSRRQARCEIFRPTRSQKNLAGRGVNGARRQAARLHVEAGLVRPEAHVASCYQGEIGATVGDGELSAGTDEADQLSLGALLDAERHVPRAARGLLRESLPDACAAVP